MSDDLSATQLLRRNREIIEVRDELHRADKQLNAIQAHNAVLLEESAELDSQIFGICGQAAAAEQRTADLWDVARRSKEELVGQQAARRATTVSRAREVESHEEALKRAESEAVLERRRAEEMNVEFPRSQERLETEEASLALVHRSLEDSGAASSVVRAEEATLAAAGAAEAELESINMRRHMENEEIVGLRRKTDTMEAELSAERERRSRLSHELRETAAEQVSDPSRHQALEVAIANCKSKGAVATGIAASLPSAGRGGFSDDVTAELREELRTMEEQEKVHLSSLERTRGNATQAAMGLQGALNDARAELQRSLRDAAQTHSTEVGRLEDEVQVERQRGAGEDREAQRCLGRAGALRDTRLRLLGQRESTLTHARADALAEAKRCAQLSEDLKRVRGEVVDEENRSLDASQCIKMAEQRKAQAQMEGEQRAANVRVMIEDLWRRIKVSAATHA